MDYIWLYRKSLSNDIHISMNVKYGFSSRLLLNMSEEILQDHVVCFMLKPECIMF